MKTNKGFTLIEIAVVLAIIAILAAILTPIVTSYIDQARVTRAVNDTRKVAEAVMLFHRDATVWPAYATFALGQLNAAPDMDCLVSDTGVISQSGQISVDTVFLGTSGITCATNKTGLLSAYLNVSTMALAPSSNEVAARGGLPTLRGPYLDGLAGSDPWGHPYLVNSSELKNSPTYWAAAWSAGPNGILDTARVAIAANFTTGASDDIAAVINNKTR